ncbi:MAG: hypothetical protein IPQ07_39990 [Myxococcales bacterium]|nr:hypothetical protein [Myxococcales bacterium]
MSKSAVLDAFLDDRDRREVWLVEVSPLRLSDGSIVTFRWASESWATLPSESPANELFSGRLVNAFNVSLEAAVAGTVGVLPGARGGEIVVGQSSGELDELETNFDWCGRSVEVSRVGYYSGGRVGYVDREVVFRGETASARARFDALVVEVRDPGRAFDSPLVLGRFPGSTWCLELGAGGSVALGSPSKLNITGDLTLAARVRFSSFAANNYLASWRSVGSSAYPFAWLVSSAGWQLYVNSAAALNGETAALALETWYQLAVTVTGSTLKCYAWNEASGRLLYASTKTLSSSSHPSGDGSLALGSHFGSASAGMMLDWLGAWNRVLTTEELDALRGRSLTAAEIAADSSLKGYYRGEEGSGTSLGDATASPANGTITSGTWRLSLGGGADLEGKTLPAAFGSVEATEPALVYAPTRIYQWHDQVAGGVSAVKAGGVALTFGSAYTTLSSFLAATTTAGKYDTLNHAGGCFVRLGSNPDKPVTVDGTGDAVGGYVSSAADVARRLVTTRGLAPLADPGGLETASFSTLNGLTSAVVGFWSPPGATGTVREAVDFVLGSVGAVGVFRRGSGAFAVWRFAAASGSAALTLDENDFRTLEPVDADPPAWAVTVRYRRCWRTLSLAEMGSALVGTAAQEFLTHEWREVRRTAPDVLRDCPRARELVVETGLSSAVDAAAECSRRLALWKVRRRAWRATASARAGAVDRFAVVTVAANDATSGTAKTGRFGLGAGTDLLALGVGGSQADGIQVVTVWG